MPTSQQEALSQVSEATLISITCRIKQHEIMTSEDLIKRAQLQKALETFSANNNGFPGQYGLGEEDAELLTDFKVCFEWVGDDKEEIGKSEEWIEAYLWTKDLLDEEIETLYNSWKRKVGKQAETGDNAVGELETLNLFWKEKIDELSKMSYKKLKEAIRELKRDVDKGKKR